MLSKSIFSNSGRKLFFIDENSGVIDSKKIWMTNLTLDELQVFIQTLDDDFSCKTIQLILALTWPIDKRV